MKKTALVCLLFVLVFSAVFPAFAQNARVTRVPVVADGEFARFERMEAVTNGSGVLVRWQMASENGNLGFYVHRVTGSGMELVASGFVQGAALRERTGTATGAEYDKVDAAGDLSSVYVIEARSSYGTSVWSAPISVKFDSLLPESYTTAVKGNGNIQSERPVPGAELKDIIEDNLLAPDLNTHHWVVGQPGAKIVVRKEGIYRVTRSQLEGAGFPVTSPSANWRLFMEGNEQAINIGPGDDYVEFYGRALDTPESDSRVYYLISDVNPGKRITTKIIRNIGGTVVSNRYQAIAEKRLREGYNGHIKNGDRENYWGLTPVQVTPPPAGSEIKFNLTGMDTSLPKAIVTIHLQGIPGQGSNHNVRAVLNGNVVGSLGGIGAIAYSGDLLVPTVRFLDGENRLALNETNAGHASYFDRVTVQFLRKYKADQDNLLFPTPGYRKVNVTNFTTPNFRVFETTYDGNPILLEGYTVQQEAATFTARIPSTRPMMVYAAADSAILTSPSVTANNPSTLYSETNRADMIIISHSAADFMTAAQSWANYRSSTAGGAFAVKVVDIQDVLDEFNYGVSSWTAVNSFLSRAYNAWQTPRPQYVLLIGDGSHDARNYEGFGYQNQVPTRIVNLLFDEAPSDDILADFNADGLSEIAIGRVSSRTAFGVNAALNKTIEFETRENQALDRGVLFAADYTSAFNDFRAMNFQMANQLPEEVPTTFVNRGLAPDYTASNPNPNAQSQLLTAMNSGQHTVNYSGHGSTGTWGSSAFFGNANVTQLANSSKPSVFVMLTCLNAYFIRPRDQDSCLSERLTNHATGAVITWSSTTETTPDFQLIMGTRFFNKMSEQTIHRIGDLIRDSKTVLPGNSDVRLSWVLLGDPALKVVYTGG